MAFVMTMFHLQQIALLGNVSFTIDHYIRNMSKNLE